MDTIKHILFFFLGIVIILIATFGAYYIGEANMLFLNPDYNIRGMDIIPLWFSGIVIEFVLVLILILAYKIGQLILD
jgi:hypothetical protein